jgi:SEFIR domain
MAESPAHVFISYSHDSPDHLRRVLALAGRLREDGIDAQLDQYVAGTPRKGWPRWMEYQLDSAKFVLVVCTETYCKRFLGRGEPAKGEGADWEGSLITLGLYHEQSDTSKFVPVVFDHKRANREFMSRSNRPYGFTCSQISGVRAA